MNGGKRHEMMLFVPNVPVSVSREHDRLLQCPLVARLAAAPLCRLGNLVVCPFAPDSLHFCRHPVA